MVQIEGSHNVKKVFMGKNMDFRHFLMVMTAVYRRKVHNVIVHSNNSTTWNQRSLQKEFSCPFLNMYILSIFISIEP